MKTYLIIAVIFISAIVSCGCAAQKSTVNKYIIVPVSNNSLVTLNSMNKAAGVIGKRLNSSLGIAPENTKLDVTEKQISLTVLNADPGNKAAIKEAITGYARLEFWETFENSEITGYLTKANNRLKEMKSLTEANNTDPQNHLLSILKLRLNEKGEPFPSCMIGLAAAKDTAAVNRYLGMAEIKALLPGNLRLKWSMNPYKYDSTNTLYELHALKITKPDGSAPLDGSVISSAKVVPGKSESNLKIGLTMNAEGTAEWAAITRANLSRCIAIVLNGSVRSYPRVQSEITGGQTEITGNFTEAEANDLVSNLNSGQLPFRLKIADEQIIKN
jgi:SecD/SecF fusion protein